MVRRIFNGHDLYVAEIPGNVDDPVLLSEIDAWKEAYEKLHAGVVDHLTDLTALMDLVKVGNQVSYVTFKDEVVIRVRDPKKNLTVFGRNIKEVLAKLGEYDS